MCPTGEEISRNILNDIEPDEMAAGRLRIGDKPLHLVIHFLRDTRFQYANIKAERTWRVVVFPPLNYVDDIAEWLNDTPHRADGSFVRVNKISTANNVALGLFRPAKYLSFISSKVS